MGFHLVDQVYANVVGTSSTAQAVLAYLAHRADDQGVRKCYPNRNTISAATHFTVRSVGTALRELREAKLLTWMSGGRRKGAGGKALANEYRLNLPSKPPPSRGKELPHAGGRSFPMQGEGVSLCIGKELPPINQDHKRFQPSVTVAGGETETEADGVEAKKMFEALADTWSASKAAARANLEGKRQIRRGVVDEAMRAAGVDDFQNRKIFSSTMLGRDTQQCLEVIFEFASQCRAGENAGLRNPAAELNRRLASLPMLR